MKPLATFTATLLLAANLPSVSAVTFQFVTVGNPGNAPDPLTAGIDGIPTNIGVVNRVYRIAKTEVTIGQYTEFLNAVAATDTHGLYDLLGMGLNGSVGNIIRSGNFGSYTYAVQAGDDPNLPVTFVDFYDTLRFANWMQNGQPSGLQDASTTEDGAYTFTGTTTFGGRNAGAQFFLPTENEWYKAAYHQPAAQGGDSDDYWLYPLQTNALPFSDNPTSLNTPDDTRAANLRADDGLANGYDDGFAVTGSTTFSNGQLYLTPVGAYGSATSYYGAHDMGGNVNEWNQTFISGTRGIRGGSWNFSEFSARSTIRGTGTPGFAGNDVGFRLGAIIPEPGRALLLVLGVCGMTLRRRR